MNLNDEVREILIDLTNAVDRQASTQITLLHSLAKRAQVALKREVVTSSQSSASVDPFALTADQLELKLEEEW
jgi:hypothetical protein